MKKLTVKEFNERFPNDDVCLNYMFNLKYGAETICECCKEKFNYTRVKGRRAYQCSNCSNQVYPTANTIFHQSTTPPTYWFLAIYLHSVCKNGVAAKELERTLNVCYKTALRMAHLIKGLMTFDRVDKLTGEIIIDESYLGGLQQFMHADKRKKLKKGSSYVNKIGVVGMINKEGTEIRTEIVQSGEVKAPNLTRILKENIEADSTIVTDGFQGYVRVKHNFEKHEVINHMKSEYARDGFSTNRIENYWSCLKRQIKGTHIAVSPKHLSKYVNENSFRYVNRDNQDKLFDIILNRA
jgi:transposase-like protein